MTTKGYLIVESKISDPVKYEVYKTLAQAAIAQYGGRYLVRGGAVEILEGKWTTPPRLVVVEIDSVDHAKAFYHSAEYQAAREVRLSISEMNMLVVSGAESLV